MYLEGRNETNATPKLRSRVFSSHQWRHRVFRHNVGRKQAGHRAEPLSVFFFIKKNMYVKIFEDIFSFF